MLKCLGHIKKRHMGTIRHKFRDYKDKENIEILILGTFNPDTPNNPAEFFYGRGKNYLWNLLPKVFDYKELKNSSVPEKKSLLINLKLDLLTLSKRSLLKVEKKPIMPMIILIARLLNG